MMMMLSQSGLGSSRCQDCGNQSKKDCVYMRCRTCCNSKGFQCQTHVKSTWVPAYRRRQRHHQLLDPSSSSFKQHNNSKRLRKDNPSSPEDRNFPAEVNLLATFRCVRVSSIDEADDEQFAYQTSVNIGGHLFRGVLYDQGPDASHYTVGESSSSQVHVANAAHHHQDLTTATATATSAAEEVPILPPSFPFPLNAFMSGMQFFQHPKSS